MPATTTIETGDNLEPILAKLRGLPCVVSEWTDGDEPDEAMFDYLVHNSAIWETAHAPEGRHGSKPGMLKGIFMEPVFPCGPEKPFASVAFVTPALYARIEAAQKALP